MRKWNTIDLQLLFLSLSIVEGRRKVGRYSSYYSTNSLRESTDSTSTPHVSNTSDQQLKCLNILRVAPWHSGCFSFCSSSKVLLVHLEFIDPAGQTF